MSDVFVFRARRSDPELGIEAGEVVIVRPLARRPVVVERELPPSYRAILQAAASGTLELVSPEPTLVELAALTGVRGGHLALVLAED